MKRVHSCIKLNVSYLVLYFIISAVISPFQNMGVQIAFRSFTPVQRL